MAFRSKDVTPMWDIMSPEDDKAMMEKFTAESNKIINRWSLGGATFTEKDAAVAFLVHLGAVQITIQSGSEQTSQKQVSVLFGDGEDSKIDKERREAVQRDTKDAIPSEGNPVRSVPDLLDQDAEKKNEIPVRLDQDTKNREAQVNEDDDDEDNNYAVWMTEPDDEDDYDDNQIPDNAAEVEDSSTTQTREEHPCPVCNTVLHSLWELDLHKLSSCTGKAPQKNANWYNCDQCRRSFVHRAHVMNHLCKVHKMSRTKAGMKLKDLRSTEKQSSRKMRKSGEKTSKGNSNKTTKKKANYDLRRNTKNLKKHSQKLLVKVQPLANGWLKILESETIDASKFTSDTLNKRSDEIALVFNDKRADLISTSDDHQILNIKTEKESSSPISDCEPVDEGREVSDSVPTQGGVQEKSLSRMAALESNEDHGCTSEQVEEKHKDNSITLREDETVADRADREKENGATIPMQQLQNKEAEVGEKSDMKSSGIPSDDNHNQECSADQVIEENKDVSTTSHMGRDPQVHETPEPTQEKNLDVTTEKRVEEVDSEGELDDSENSEINQKPAKGKNIICKFCDLQFKTDYRRKLHVLKNHTSGVQEYKCSTCNKCYIHKGAFKLHVKTHMDINDREKFHCEICKKSFLVKFTYQKHMKDHVEKPEPFKCDTCGKVLTTKRGLEGHINSQHTKETIYKCEVCGWTTYTKHHYKQHVETHTGQRTWKCDQCEFAAFREYNLKVHKQKVHTDGCFCLCEICGAAYKTPASLKQHHLTAHTNNYKFSCDVCGKKFKRSTHRNAHVKIHTKDPKNKPFVCEICGKGFRAKIKLQVHNDWHNNIRSHTCQDCGKSFLTKGNLDKHRSRVHIAKKPHKCRICSRCFVDMPELRKHLASKHQITLKKRVRKGVSDERINKGSATHLLDHKLGNRPSSPSTMVSDSEDRSEVGDVGHLEISDAVAQLPETSDSQIVREALLAMMND